MEIYLNSCSKEEQEKLKVFYILVVRYCIKPRLTDGTTYFGIFLYTNENGMTL